ncbi:MAG: CmcI family methyltransferase, partial [Thermodesulfobacteriota bacterium]
MSDQEKDPTAVFFEERATRTRADRDDPALQEAAAAFKREIVRTRYSFNFSWLGRPVIQIPQDLMALQEIIWEVRPDCIVETGIARGGSLIFYASMLELLG